MSSISGIRVSVDGEIRDATITGPSLLDAFYADLDCHNIDVVQLRDEIDMVIDDEGKILGRYFNPHATAIAGLLGWPLINRDFIVGDVMLVGYTDEGDHVDLTRAQRNLVWRASRVPFRVVTAEEDGLDA